MTDSVTGGTLAVGNRLAGKVVLVTGAARGQGRCHAIGMARQGADIIAVDACTPVGTVDYPMANEDDLAATGDKVEAEGRRCLTFVADVRDPAALGEAISAAVGSLGRLDVCVANAGILSPGPSTELPAERWRETIDINLTGVWNTCQATIRHLVAQGAGGSIVITSSVAGLKGLATMASYSAAKHGVVGLAKALAAEFASHRIRVNCIHPSSVATPMIHNDATYQLFTEDGDPDRARDQMAERMLSMHPLGVPWIEPEDVTNAVVFLASEESRYITGISLPIDAGALLL